MYGSADKLAATLKACGRILIIIQGSPDPDAMASSFVFHKICEHLGVKSTIVANKNLSLPVNREFVKLLEMPIKFVKKIQGAELYDSYAILDHQHTEVEGISIPCSVHIDHHEPLQDQVPATYSLIDQKAGSTCTMIALLLQELRLEIGHEEMSKIATALLYGIHTDTDKYAFAGDLDFRAMNYISKYSDSSIIRKLTEYPISIETVGMIGMANSDKVVYKDWIIAGVGYIDAAHRDSITLTADFLLKQNDSFTIIVFAAVEDSSKHTLTIDASLRSADEDLNLDIIIKEITSNGGARKFKGAYQINLDYFFHCPERDTLWEVIRSTTIDILKRRRDHVYISELKGIYHRVKQTFKDILS